MHEAYVANVDLDRHIATTETIQLPTGTTSSELNKVKQNPAGGFDGVGSYTDSGGQTHAYIIHRSAPVGTIWSLVGTFSNSILYKVGFSSATDGWAVGVDLDTLNGLVAHWDGTGWTTVSFPLFHIPTVLKAVYPVGPNDVYVVGSWSDTDGTLHPFGAHWNGTSWTEVSPPLAAPAELDAISHPPDLPPSEFYMVGSTGTDTATRPLVEFYNGSTYNPLAIPTFTGAGALTDVTDFQGGIMASGVITLTQGTTSPLAIKGDYLNGLGLAPPPAIGSVSRLTGLTTLLNGDAFAVGTFQDSGVSEQFFEQYHCGEPTPSPTPSCPMNSTDVHPADYFYTPVHALSCWNVVSGYTTSPPCPSGQNPCYDPYKNTTRGQMVKIAVLGFGLPTVTPTPGGYTFTDVHPSSAFFPYVETTYANGTVSGYACGRPGEPCDPLHRPYFRPGTFVTRGQLAKIDVTTAGWPLSNPVTSSFEDVLPSSLFYGYVETAFCHGVIQGYISGGAGEPCDPQHRPYFRVQSEATRGQIAKIVYLSIVNPPVACGQ